MPMPIISISKVTGDATGFLKFRPSPKSEFKKSQARVSRSATLDGGAVIDHQGVCDGDREFTIRTVLDETDSETLKSLYEDNTFLLIAVDGGVYYGAISRLNIDRGDVSLTFLVQE